MAKEIYLYSGLYNSSAMELMQAVTEMIGKDCTILENCYGGDVFATMGIQAKFKEHGNVTVKVMGAAFSGGFNILMYAKKVIALSTARFLIHRADGYASTPEEKALLDSMNVDLKAQMSKRVDDSKLIAMKGVSMDALFNPETRIDLFLTAQEMKELNMVDEIEVLSPMEMKAHEELMFRVAANYTEPKKIENPTNIVMTTLAELKEKFPALYALAVADGVKAEKDRVGAVLVFAHLDMEGAKKIIASGEPMTATQMAEFSLKQLSPEALKKIEVDAAGKVITEEIAVTKEALAKKEVDVYEASVRASLGLDKNKTQGKQVVLVQE